MPGDAGRATCECAWQCSDGGVFQGVEWDASIFFGVDEGDIILQTYPLPGPQAAERSRPCPPCVLPAQRMAVSRHPREGEVSRYVLEFTQRHRGLVVRVSGIGAREALMQVVSSRRSSASASWLPREVSIPPGQPRCTSKTHDCVKVAVIKAAFACRGLVVAEAWDRVLERESQIFHNFRTLGEIFHRAQESVTGCGVVRDEEVQRAIQGGERTAPFRVLAARRAGVFIVRIQEEKRVHHAVVVDAPNGVIIDSEAQTALELSVENLARFGGDSALKLRVIEEREMRSR